MFYVVEENISGVSGHDGKRYLIFHGHVYPYEEKCLEIGHSDFHKAELELTKLLKLENKSGNRTYIDQYCYYIEEE